MGNIIINRLQPSAVHKIWSKLLYGIQQAAPVTNSRSNEAYNNVLAALLSERAQCFVAYEPNETPNVHGFVISLIQTDTLSNDRYLFIYAIYAFQNMPQDVWDSLYGAITAFAQQYDCIRIVGFTSNTRVLQQCLRLGAKQDVTFLYKEL